MIGIFQNTNFSSQMRVRFVSIMFQFHFSLSTGVPDIPSGPIEITKVTAESATLKWSPPDDVGDSPLESYKVYETHDDKDWKRLEIIKPPSTSCKAKGLKDGKVYKFSVIAKNQQGKGARLVSEPFKPCREGKTLSDLSNI